MWLLELKYQIGHIFQSLLIGFSTQRNVYGYNTCKSDRITGFLRKI